MSRVRSLLPCLLALLAGTGCRSDSQPPPDGSAGPEIRVRVTDLPAGAVSWEPVLFIGPDGRRLTPARRRLSAMTEDSATFHLDPPGTIAGDWSLEIALTSVSECTEFSWMAPAQDRQVSSDGAQLADEFTFSFQGLTYQKESPYSVELTLMAEGSGGGEVVVRDRDQPTDIRLRGQVPLMGTVPCRRPLRIEARPDATSSFVSITSPTAQSCNEANPCERTLVQPETLTVHFKRNQCSAGWCVEVADGDGLRAVFGFPGMGSDDTEVIAVGDRGRALVWNGLRWNELRLGDVAVYGVWGTESAGTRRLWVVGSDRFLKVGSRTLPGGAWVFPASAEVVQDSMNYPLRGVWGRGDGSNVEVIAVGDLGRTVRWSGAVAQARGIASDVALNGVWGDANGYWAMGYRGGAGAIFQGDRFMPPSWTEVPGLRLPQLNGVWSNGEGTWTIGTDGMVRSAAVRWDPVTPAGPPLWGISGSGVSVWAVGDQGAMLVRDKSGGDEKWNSTSLTNLTKGVPLRGVYGDGRGRIWAVGGQGVGGDGGAVILTRR